MKMCAKISKTMIQENQVQETYSSIIDVPTEFDGY